MTDFLQRFDKGARLRLNGDWVTVESSIMHKGRPHIKLEGVNDMTAAEKLQWQYLEAPAMRPELEDDEFYTADLIGMKVVTTEGEELGVVDNVVEYPAHEVIEVGEIMIPAVKEFIKDVDLEKEVITVQLIEGMRPGEES